LHKCDEAKKYRKRMAILISSDGATCAYGCSNGCSHPSAKDIDAPVRANVTETDAKRPSDRDGERTEAVGTVAAIVPPAFASELPVREFEHSGSVRVALAVGTTLTAIERRRNTVVAMAKRG
jgi:hypothetical protein